jgi:hypothetical protein
MIRIQTFLEKETYDKIDKARGDVPMSMFVRKVLEKKKW